MWHTLSYFPLRGDAINGHAPHERLADPSRMLSAYWHAAATLNYMRMQGYLGGSSSGSGGCGSSSSSVVYTSHECLLLPMEAAMTDAATRLNQVVYCV